MLRQSLPRNCKNVTVARRFVDCGSCGEVVRKRQEQLICRECGLSYHRTCSTMVREDFRRLKRDGGLGGWVCGCIQDEEAQPRVRQVQEQAPVPVVPVLVRAEPVVPVPEPARVEPVIPEPARVVPDVPVEVREEQPVPASSSVTRRVVGGVLSATRLYLYVASTTGHEASDVSATRHLVVCSVLLRCLRNYSWETSINNIFGWLPALL